MNKTQRSVFGRRSAIAITGAAALVLQTRTARADTPLKIATIGSGQIGGTLGAVWAKAGHQVMFSSRHPEELKDLVTRLGPSARAGTVAEAAAFGDVVLLAVPYRAMPDLSKEVSHALANKLLVFDACNPYPNRDGDVALKVREAGAGTYAAMLFPGAHIVRAFNAIHAARFGEGGRDGGGARIGIPIAGDDPKALKVATDLIGETGFVAVVVGSLNFGNNLVPGSPLAGEHTPAEIHKIAATLK